MNAVKSLDGCDDFESRLTALEQATVNLINSVAENNAMVDKLIEQQKETGEHLNAVIFIMEKFFGGQNGKTE